MKTVFITYTSNWLFMGFENWKYQLFSIMHIVPVHFVLIETYDFIYVFFLLTSKKKKKKEKNVKPIKLAGQQGAYAFLFKNHLSQRFKVEKSKHNNGSTIKHTHIIYLRTNAYRAITPKSPHRFIILHNIYTLRIVYYILSYYYVL